MSISTTSNLNKNWIIYSFPLIAVLIWAINIVVTRYMIDFISPISISFYRWFIAWLVLTPFILPKVIKNWGTIQPNIIRLAILGLFGMVCYQGFAYSAAQYTTATNMGIINAFIPIFSILLSIIFLKIRPNKIAIFGTIISITGLAYLITQGDFSKLLQGSHIIGDLLMIIAVALYAFYGVFLQRWQVKLALPLMLYMQISFAVIFHLPLLMYFGLDMLNQQNISSVIYAAIFPSILAPMVWILAIQNLGSNRSSIFMNLIPIVTAIIAYLFLQEQWSIYHTIGGAMVLGGLILTQKH